VNNAVKSTVKTTEQIEFNDLFDVLENAGWTRAKVSRALDYSTGAAVTMILKGETGVSEFRLKKMRELVASLKTAESPPGDLSKFTVPSHVQKQLDQLPQSEQDEVLELFNVLVEQAVKRVTGKGKQRGK
jgi:hypothetical protein